MDKTNQEGFPEQDSPQGYSHESGGAEEQEEQGGNPPPQETGGKPAGEVSSEELLRKIKTAPKPGEHPEPAIHDLQAQNLEIEGKKEVHKAGRAGGLDPEGGHELEKMLEDIFKFKPK